MLTFIAVEIIVTTMFSIVCAMASHDNRPTIFEPQTYFTPTAFFFACLLNIWNCLITFRLQLFFLSFALSFSIKLYLGDQRIRNSLISSDCLCESICIICGLCISFEVMHSCLMSELLKVNCANRLYKLIRKQLNVFFRSVQVRLLSTFFLAIYRFYFH